MTALVARGAVLYLGAVNIGSFGLFGYDKWQAGHDGWRVSEADLCKSALLGGWIGGVLAMQMFRHKTRKESFKRKYTGAIALNSMVLFGTLGVGFMSGTFRRAFKETGRSAVSFAVNQLERFNGNGRTGGSGPGPGRRKPRRYR